MAGDLNDSPTGAPHAQAYENIEGTGTTRDDKAVLDVAIIDPNTGLPMVPGSVTFTTLTIADGADVAEGHVADAVVQGDVAGSVSAKLRGVNKVLGAIADAAWTTGSGSVVALLKALAGLLAHGQAAMVASVPVVIASDQSAVPITSADIDSYFQAHDYTSNSGGGPTLDLSASMGLVYSAQVTADGTVTSFSVTIEGSLDGTNWATVLTLTNSAPALNGISHATAEPLKYVRSNCGALTLNSATKITVNLLALR